MKTMTCRQLGGACDTAFHAETFEEIAELSKEHGMEMHGKNDEIHMRAMQEMRNLMNDSKAMETWVENKRKEFDALPEEMKK